MSDQAVHEMICAYASGCLDKENYIQFRKYLDEGGKLPKRELGETMNLMSLIPAMLEIEEPRPELKAEVAKKILTYQDEIKEKIKQIKKTRTGTVTSVEKTTVKKPSTEPVEEKTIKESEPEKKSDVNVEVPKEEKAAAEVHKKAAPKLHSAEIEEGDYVPDPTPMIKKPMGIWVWITLVILFLLLGALSVYHFFVVDNYESTINNLKREAIDTRAELREKESYLNSVNPLVEFMAKRQIKTIDIEGTDLAKNANGKLMVSVADNTALLDINNLPPIEQNLKFRLWIVSEGKSYPSIIFDYNQNTRYYFIENFPQVRFLDIELVRITAERNSINEIPEGNTYAFGAPLFN